MRRSSILSLESRRLDTCLVWRVESIREGWPSARALVDYSFLETPARFDPDSSVVVIVLDFVIVYCLGFIDAIE